MSSDQANEFKSALDEALSKFGIDSLDEGQRRQLITHYSMLRRWNQRLNLTRIIEPDEAARLHYAESLFGARFIDGERTLLDIGSGAGFPAIPLAVAKPQLLVTALDSNNKKSLFLKEVKDELGLDNLKVVTARLDEYDWAGQEILTSRALDRAELVLPLLIGRLKPAQRLMLYCGPELMAKLEGEVNRRIETHQIPHSKTRLIAIISQD